MGRGGNRPGKVGDKRGHWSPNAEWDVVHERKPRSSSLRRMPSCAISRRGASADLGGPPSSRVPATHRHTPQSGQRPPRNCIMTSAPTVLGCQLSRGQVPLLFRVQFKSDCSCDLCFYGQGCTSFCMRGGVRTNSNIGVLAL